MGFFNRCLKVLRPVLFARLFKTVLHALAASRGNWEYYCEVTLNKKRTTTKGKKTKQTHPPPKNPQPNLLIEAFTSISSVHIKTLGSAELLKTLGHC